MKWNIALILLISFCFIHESFAQNPNKKIKISGVVLDPNQKPVPNVMIFVDKVKTNSVTDSKGVYHVKVSPAAKQIVAFSYFNGVKEMDINGNTVVNFKLDVAGAKANQPDRKESEMINVGYGEIDKKNLTVPVNRIEGNRSKYASYNNVFEMISGEVPGVVVSGTSINIQNSFSFQLSTEPLFVVDGIIVKEINDIVPAQVKSIEILKGASASIYGARGANGVIVISLVDGSSDK